MSGRAGGRVGGRGLAQCLFCFFFGGNLRMIVVVSGALQQLRPWLVLRLRLHGAQRCPLVLAAAATAVAVAATAVAYDVLELPPISNRSQVCCCFRDCQLFRLQRVRGNVWIHQNVVQQIKPIL